MIGRTRNFKEVSIKNTSSYEVGSILNVKITGLNGWGLLGEVIQILSQEIHLSLHTLIDDISGEGFREDGTESLDLCLLEHDIFAQFFVPFSIVVLVISGTPWERYDELAYIERVELCEGIGTSSCDSKISSTEDGSERVWIYPIIESDVSEFLELFSEFCIEKSEHNNPLNIYSATLFSYGSKYIPRSLTSTDDEHMTHPRLPVLKSFGWLEKFWIEYLSCRHAF